MAAQKLNDANLHPATRTLEVKMNPLFVLATDAMINATTTLNETAINFMENQWPVFMNHTTFVWNRFKEDPDNWIALYPLTFFMMALVIWSSSTPPPPPLPMPSYKDFDEILGNNILVRRRGNTTFYVELSDALVNFLQEQKDGTHPMRRRSQGPAPNFMLK
jgi:hypothetical protein